MIKEFAVEPEVMATWAHFQSLFEDFGVGKGRLISRFPKDWAMEVERLARQLSPPVRANAIAAKIFAHKHKFIQSRRDYDRSKTWLINAESQMAAKPFHAVIARQSSRRHPEVLDIESEKFDKSIPPYHVEVEAKVARSPEALARCAELLLSVCEELQLVDPNFDPAEPRFVDTVKAILAIRPPALQRLKRFEIHAEKKPNFNRANREHHLRRAFQDVIPASTTLRVYFWLERPVGEELHPRFLLTELGGLKYDYGFDEGRNPGGKTLVSLLDHMLFLQIRADYTYPSPTFDITPDCIIDILGQG